jgi:putative endonuclease
MERGGTVYILTNKRHTVLYTGVTADLLSRISEHLHRENSYSFTAKYNCVKLVYYCFYSTIDEAIAEEKRIKGGSRNDKLRLINTTNPEWKDLYEREVRFW